MFAPRGTPLRATCTDKVKEVPVLSKLAAEGNLANKVLQTLQTWTG